jgi:hypothetical protein
VLDPHEEDLPELPEFSVLMMKGKAPPQPATDRLAEHITEAVRVEAQKSGWRS